MIGSSEEKYKKIMLKKLMDKLKYKMSKEAENKIVNETKQLLQKIHEENPSLAEYFLKEVQTSYSNIPELRNFKL